jgi:hypothetical protein
MYLYLANSRIPELANLSKAQRRFVRSQCLFWMFRRLPYLAGSWAVTIGSVLLGAYLIGALKWHIWEGAALAGISALVLDYLHDMIWVAHWRPEVWRFIQNHATEIEAAA